MGEATSDRPTCRGCEYGEALREPTSFRCRRHAPRPGTGNSEGIAWPVVSADDWCGEYLRRGFLGKARTRWNRSVEANYQIRCGRGPGGFRGGGVGATGRQSSLRQWASVLLGPGLVELDLAARRAELSRESPARNVNDYVSLTRNRKALRPFDAA